MMEMATTVPHGYTMGDVICAPFRLSRRDRFLIWLAQPLHWPPKISYREMEITAVTSDTTFAVADGNMFLT